jgi:hypothetical protein
MVNKSDCSSDFLSPRQCPHDALASTAKVVGAKSSDPFGSLRWTGADPFVSCAAVAQHRTILESNVPATAAHKFRTFGKRSLVVDPDDRLRLDIRPGEFDRQFS